ncbi:hypothetical protein SASPL_109125 [Salvia splendens]|uniref:Uncharacterized protein n=1 Tax=Salvia splendens TaxID=180675 RepID=A0A8X8YFR0_SALSN|nr:hypothetical protein SASPL_109125 [Salvia splendens]
MTRRRRYRRIHAQTPPLCDAYTNPNNVLALDQGSCSSSDGSHISHQSFSFQGIDDHHQNLFFNDAGTSTSSSNYARFNDNPQDYYSSIEEIKELITINDGSVIYYCWIFIWCSYSLLACRRWRRYLDYSNSSKPSTSPSPANSPPHFSPHNATSPITPAQQLQAFLQLKYQWIHDPSQSPFATHPIANRVAVATSALHYLGCADALSFPPLHRLAHHLIVSSSYAAVAALLSVILPDSAAQCVYVVFGLL